MKTIKFAFLTLITSIVLLSACQKDELDVVPNNSQNDADYKTTQPGPPVSFAANWREDFATAGSLAKWNLFGSPQPQWVYFAAKRFGLFDNNGRLPGGSYAVSKKMIGYGQGYTIESEVYIDINKPSATIICPQIGVTRNSILSSEPNTIESGISMKLMYVSLGNAGIPEEYHNRTFVMMSALLQDGRLASSSDPKDGTISAMGDYAFPADAATNGWHKMKIVVNSLGQVSFYLDNKFVWTPGRPIHSSLMKNRNVLLGFTSPGKGGKAYHDYVKVTYPKGVAIEFCPAELETVE